MPVYGPPALAVGACAAGAAITAVVVAVLVSVSVLATVSVTLYVPAVAYVCTGATPDPVLPSPKLQLYVSASLRGSLEPDPLNVSATPLVPVYGPPAFATGACAGAAIVAVVLAVALRPSVLVTVSETL